MTIEAFAKQFREQYPEGSLRRRIADDVCEQFVRGIAEQCLCNTWFCDDPCPLHPPIARCVL